MCYVRPSRAVEFAKKEHWKSMNESGTPQEPGEKSSGVHRRTIIKGAAWSVPVVAAMSVAPRAAASAPSGTSPFHWDWAGGSAYSSAAGTITGNVTLLLQFVQTGNNQPPTGTATFICTVTFAGPTPKTVDFTIHITQGYGEHGTFNYSLTGLAAGTYTPTSLVVTATDEQGHAIPHLAGQNSGNPTTGTPIQVS